MGFSTLYVAIMATLVTFVVAQDEGCDCSREEDPVCGSNGVTYPNPCNLRCAQRSNSDLVAVYHGACHEVPHSVTLRGGCVCTTEYDPVCGSNGVTYGNRCGFTCAQRRNPELSIDHDGVCTAVEPRSGSPRSCICTREYDPVCGSDGITYDNPCAFNCSRNLNPTLTIVNEGPCGRGRGNGGGGGGGQPPNKRPNTCICTKEFDPVCGSDGFTYSNRCQLGCMQNINPFLTEAHTGPCEGPKPPINGNNRTMACFCTLQYDPVCGSDGVTYGNRCQFTCAQMHNPTLSIENDGPCTGVDPRTNPRSCLCTFEYAPVCGTDGITYSNRCLLNCAQRLNPSLSVQSSGPCRGAEPRNTTTGSCICTLEYDPVCGSDGVTYGNRCQFTCIQRFNPSLSINHTGPCTTPAPPNLDNCRCTREYNPICGSNGITYANRCLFNCSQNLNPTLTIANEAACTTVDPGSNQNGSCICTAQFDPVCGSDGRTYSNLCRLTCAKRLNLTLTVAHFGECVEIVDPPTNTNNTRNCICTTEYDPVCGSDDITYENRCRFNCAQRLNPDLIVVRNGQCQGPSPPPNKNNECICPSNYAPVCCSNGRTYSNRCQLDCDQRRDPSLKFVREGGCGGRRGGKGGRFRGLKASS